MSFDGLRSGLRWLFWTLVYVGTVCAALLAFAPAGAVAVIGWAAVLYVIWHDAHKRFATS